ncbi:uncharacterized protein JCM15063_003730 [Sporobolomyces koalae]|uniref:uncharacterized protein n=1 Tax=Sporobolomyces koalae TaxID=500713 RepID=UPI00317D2F94
MSKSSPHSLFRQAAPAPRTCRTAQSSTIYPERHRHAHTRAQERTAPASHSTPPRRSAHALASHSRYHERGPLPPSSPTPHPAKHARESTILFAPREAQIELENVAFPVWESHSAARQAPVEHNLDYGDTVYAEDLEGQVDFDWYDYRPDEPPHPVVLLDPPPTQIARSVAQPAPPRPPQKNSNVKARTPEKPLFTERARTSTSSRTHDFVLQPAAPLRRNTVSPYIPPPVLLPSCPVHPSPQPHEVPLLSRSDWRLSSPLRKVFRSNPYSLFSRYENDTKSQGHNHLVGVGIETSRISKSYRHKDVEGSEPWGWKTKVNPSERGDWPAADLYRKRLDRLIALSRKADEETYRLSLARQGTPVEREAEGKTLCRAVATWLTDSSRAEELQELKRNKSSNTAATTVSASTSTAKAVASFQAQDGRELTEDLWDFAPANTIIRISRAASESESDQTGPQPPPSASSDPKDWFVQGTVLEARGTQLVVSFDESDMWPIHEDDVFQIDIGLDESSYTLQEQAINNLHFDPARQRLRNSAHVHEAQQAYLSGSTPTIREWTLQGTDLRELIVPKVENGAPKLRAWHEDEEDPLEDSPSADITHLPPPESLLTPQFTSDIRTESSRAIHPSDLITQNQLINSWVQRHMRDDPMSLPGDPDLGLNASQTKAIAMAIGEKLSVIQGPPGTGKSQTIVSLIALLKLHFRIPQPILLAAPTHVSTDHLLSLLVRRGLNPLRCGKPSKVAPEIEKWTIEKRQEHHPLWNRLEETRINAELARDELKRSRELTLQLLDPQERKIAEARNIELEQAYRRLWRKFIMLEQRLYSSLLATADVFCATALGSGASKVLSMVDFPIVFLDEAAMCTEPVTLIPIMKGAQQVTLIGDHKQLPAVVSSQEAKKERLQISLFERLLTSQDVNSVLLDTQYRMRPAISDFPNLSFYRSALQDAPTVSNRPPAPRSAYFTPRLDTSGQAEHSLDPVPVAFVSHSGVESTSKRSTQNRVEVDVILEIVGDLLHRNPALDPRDIGIISPYIAQTNSLVHTFESGWAAKRLSGSLGWSRASELRGVEINTVDGFQGREKKVIILSTVRSNKYGRIGFLTDKRRLNVALTRARDALFVVGNKDTLKLAANHEWNESDPDSDAGIWARFLTWCERRGLVKEWEALQQN